MDEKGGNRSYNVFTRDPLNVNVESEKAVKNGNNTPERLYCKRCLFQLNVENVQENNLYINRQ